MLIAPYIMGWLFMKRLPLRTFLNVLYVASARERVISTATVTNERLTLTAVLSFKSAQWVECAVRGACLKLSSMSECWSDHTWNISIEIRQPHNWSVNAFDIYYNVNMFLYRYYQYGTQQILSSLNAPKSECLHHHVDSLQLDSHQQCIRSCYEQ